MTVDESVEMITCAVEADRIKESPRMSEALYDLSLKHKAQAALVEVIDKVEWVEVELDKGVASLTGLVSSPAVKKECAKAISNIQGVKSVHNGLNVRDDKRSVF
jgi:osmotically-inducible protein OsmY